MTPQKRQPSAPETLRHARPKWPSLDPAAGQIQLTTSPNTSSGRRKRRGSSEVPRAESDGVCPLRTRVGMKLMQSRSLSHHHPQLHQRRLLALASSANELFGRRGESSVSEIEYCRSESVYFRYVCIASPL